MIHGPNSFQQIACGSSSIEKKVRTPIATSGGYMERTPNRRLRHIQQRWKLVAACLILAVLAATAYTLTSHPSYTARSALILAGRAPEQDALAVQGFVTIFNDAPTVDRLRAASDIPHSVGLEARTAAASPILIIEATADRPDLAQSAAEDTAKAFRADINATQQEGKQGYIDSLRQQLSRIGPIAPNGQPDPYYAAVQDRIDNVEADITNQLQLFQPRLGVEEKAPSLTLNLTLGAIGGLVIGSVAALAMAACSRRVKTAADLRDRTGVEPLAEVPAAGTGKRQLLREERLRTLANIVSANLPKPVVIAVADADGGRGAREIAEALSVSFARRGHRAVLVHADNEPSGLGAGPGFNGLLADSRAVQAALVDGETESLQLLPAGPVVPDRYATMTRERIDRVFGELRQSFEAIVVAAPPAGEADGQVLCAAADATILVVIKDSSRFTDVSSSAAVLKAMHAVVLGAVLMDGTRAKPHRRQPSDGPAPGSPPTAAGPTRASHRLSVGDRASQPIL